MGLGSATKEDHRMAKGSLRRPDKYNRKGVKVSDELKDTQRIKDREKENQKSKALVRQMRGKKWSEDDFDEDLENERI
jgi:hypothetical protein